MAGMNAYVSTVPITGHGVTNHWETGMTDKVEIRKMHLYDIYETHTKS